MAESAVAKVVADIGIGEEVEDVPAELDEFLLGASGTVAQETLELTEGQFDRVEFGRVRR